MMYPPTGHPSTSLRFFVIWIHYINEADGNVRIYCIIDGRARCYNQSPLHCLIRILRPAHWMDQRTKLGYVYLRLLAREDRDSRYLGQVWILILVRDWPWYVWGAGLEGR